MLKITERKFKASDSSIVAIIMHITKRTNTLDCQEIQTLINSHKHRHGK